jgi:hypothetical protein
MENGRSKEDMKQQSWWHGKTNAGLALGGATLAALSLSVRAATDAITVPVDVGASRYNLYVDPYNGNTVKLGGFSGLFPVPGRPDWLYVVTDRGPNPDYTKEGVAGKIFIRPDFGPQIITLHLHPSGTARIVEIMPLKSPERHGDLITGLPPTPTTTVTRQPWEVLWDLGLNPVPNDEDGIDTEGLTMDAWGHFWVCEESKPSIAMVDRRGRVQLRLVPKGTLTGKETIPCYDILPKIFKERYNNRGLEGIAYADGVVYSIMQRPLSNPTSKASEASQNIRVLAVDLKAVLRGNDAASVKQFIYRTDPFVEPFTSNKGVYASDLFAISDTQFLVPERQTDKLYCFDISEATDITGKEDGEGLLISPPPGKTTIEQLSAEELTALGITPVAKTVLLPSLTAIDPGLAKCEGVCLIGRTIVLTLDNDFNIDPATAAPSDHHPGWPEVQVNLQKTPNLPRLFLVPLPPGILDGHRPHHHGPPWDERDPFCHFTDR